MLVQLLVFADYLGTFTAAQRTKLAAVSNKAAIQPNTTLSDEQAKTLDGVRERVQKQLARLPPDGPAFAELVRHILEREHAWVAWKLESCPAFEKSAIDAAVFAPKKRRREDVRGRACAPVR